MSDHLDRAAEVIAAQMHGLTTPSMCRGIARALEEAGLLVTPERDAGVAAKALREAATQVNDPASTPEVESAAHAVIYLHDRADAIEQEAGESDADA